VINDSTPSAPRAEPAADAYFDSLAILFEQFTTAWDQADPRFTGWLTANLPAAAQTAVDLGCGGGRHTSLLADRCQRVLAVDVSEGMLRLARAARPAANVDYQRRGVLDVSAGTDGRFDVVLSVHTLHHVGDPTVVLPHVRSLAAPGGTAILADIINPGRWTDPAFHVERAFDTARQLYQLRAEAGHAADAAEDAADVLRLLLHPDWLAMTATDTPLTGEAFHRHYGRVFPGAEFTELGPLMCGMVWHAPGHRLNASGPAGRPGEHRHVGL
jgi:2-polyprenyl-3-methyl-5-hydroxy-6-metoxy-1,4-benzoquinol methylase